MEPPVESPQPTHAHTEPTEATEAVASQHDTPLKGSTQTPLKGSTQTPLKDSESKKRKR